MAFSFFLCLAMIFSESLKKSKDFAAVYRSHRSRADRSMVMYVMKNGTDRNRLGISVSKKVGNSVVRHHLTRLVREAYRLNEEQFLRGYDIVVIARKGSADIDFHTVQDSLLKLASASGIRVKAQESGA